MSRDTIDKQHSGASAFSNFAAPPCVHRGFYSGLRHCSGILSKKRLTDLIHRAPPPLPARFLPSSTGNWTARHRARSGIAGQAPTTEKSSCKDHTYTDRSSHSSWPDLLLIWLHAESRWRIPLLPGQCPQVWSFYTFPPARWKIGTSWEGCLSPIASKYKVGKEDSRLTLSFSVARTSSFLQR